VTGSAETIDYDLHGLVGIRLIDPRPSDVHAVSEQLGPFRRVLTREPDIVLRFVDRLLPEANLRLLGAGEAAFTDDAFLLLRSRHKAGARVRMPFLDLGRRCEIVIESGLPAVPLLIATINLTALGRGIAPLHASAFTFEGRGILVTGWSKGGKTEALIGFASRGAQYVGDEWIYLDPASGRMYGLPQPIRLWDWHLAQFPEYRARIPVADRSRLRAISAADATLGAMAAAMPAGSRPRRSGERMRSALRRQVYVDVGPEALFGALQPMQAPVDRVFLLASHESQHFEVTPIDARALGQRMVSSVRYEFATFLSYYDMFRFAFPGANNPLIESLEERLGPLLAQALDGKPAFAAYHPYPFQIAALLDAMRPHI